MENSQYKLMVENEDYVIGETIIGNIYELILYEGLEERVSKNEFKISSQETRMEILSTNIDKETGDVLGVKTTSGTFDKDGMHYEKSNSSTSSTINNVGLEVKETSTNIELLFAGYDEEENVSVVRTENMTVRNYLVCGTHARFEEYDEGWGLFIV